MEASRYKKGGDAGSKGVDFQVGLLSLFLLNAPQRFRDWELTTENDRAGKFDDVVLEWPEGAVLLQAKHKKNCRIAKQDLLSTNSKNADFSLPKYFLSYQEIKSEFKGDVTLVVCSNADVHEKAVEFLQRQRIPPESVLYHANDEYCFYKLDAQILPHLKLSVEEYLGKTDRNVTVDHAVITDENLNDFVDRLQIFASFPADKDLENVIEQSLASMKRSNAFYETIFALELRSKVTDWFQHKHVVNMNEAELRAMFSELRTEKYRQALDQYRAEFRRDHLWLSDSKRIHYAVVQNGYLPQAIKIHHTLRNLKGGILWITPDDNVETQRQIVESFRLKRYAFLVVVWPKRTEDSVITEIADKLSGIIKTQQDKKLFLVTESVVDLDRLFGVSGSSGSATFDDLTDETQENLLNKKNVVFHGRDVSLKELFPKRDCSRAADLLLQKLIEDEKVSVGAPLLTLDQSMTHLYVTRTFKRRIGRTNISCSENDIYDVQEKIVLISDTAGMGKTTVLTNLAASLKRKYPLLWVIQLELINFLVAFKNLSKSHEPITVLDLLNSKGATKLTHELEHFIFATEGRVCLILDGVDEVSPDYTDLVVNLLLQCQEASNFAKVFVSTRPHVVPELQRKLHVALFTLEPFADQNRVHFLTNYWWSRLNLEDADKEKCETYARVLVHKMSLTDQNNNRENQFAAIPLQLRMLAEIFQESTSSNDWEGCKEYAQSNEKEPRLPERINFVELYDMFIDKKRDMFIERENPDGLTAASQALRSQFEECLQFHRNIALNIVLAEEDRRLFSCYGKTKDVEAIALMIGIVEKSKDEFSFIHRTLAEYYVADSIMKELKLRNDSLAFQKFLIEEVFYTDKYDVVLTFLDNFLQSNLDSIPYDIFKTYKSKTSCDRSSTWKYKNNLIHRLAEKGYVSVLDLLLKCAKFAVVTEKNGQIYHFDANYKKKNRNALTCLKHLLKHFGLNVEDDFHRTPLHFAASKGHLRMVKFLVERGANINSKDELIEAAQNGQVETAKYLLKRVLGIETDGIAEAVKINDSDMESLLLEIVQGNNGLNVEDMKVPYVAASMGCLEALKACVERGVDVNGKFENGETLIIGAACGRHREIIEYLVQEGADINSVNKIGRSALHLIAQDPSSVPTAELLIRLGIDIHATDSVGKTAFHLAASSSHFEMMKLLISSGVNVNVKDKIGNAALHEAAAYGNLTCVEFLTTNGADVNTIDGKGNTALLLCVGQWRASEIASTLVDSGAAVNIQNYRGQTAFHVAVSADDETMVRFLVNLERDADTRSVYEELQPSSNVLIESNGIINNKDKEGRTALHLAAERGRASLVGILIEAGADVFVRDDDGRTPLHVAADRGREEVALLLIERGADIECEDNFECTPAILAKKAGHLHLLRYLRVEEKPPKPVLVRILSGGCLR